MQMYLASTLFNAYHVADGLGKLIFWFLFILSFSSWVVIVHKIRTLRAFRRQATTFYKMFEKNKSSFLRIQIEPSSNRNCLFEKIFLILQKGTLEILQRNNFFLSEKNKEKNPFLSSDDVKWVASILDSEIQNQVKNLEKHLFFLPMVVTLAPFLGLLGTVWGILISFAGMQNTLAAGNGAVLSGLAMALGATVVGLIVAIPALVGYNYLKSKIKELVFDLEHFSWELISHVEFQYRKVDLN